MFFSLFPDEVDETFVPAGELLKHQLTRVEEHLLLLIHLLIIINYFISNTKLTHSTHSLSHSFIILSNHSYQQSIIHIYPKFNNLNHDHT